jgi:hypothetical protein
MEHQYETCQIKSAGRRHEYRLLFFTITPKNSHVYQYVAEVTSPTGGRIVAASREVIDLILPKKRGDQNRLLNLENTLYNEVVQQLLADGWEPTGTDDHGRISTFKRPV